jgi:hypothetical protein
VFLHGENRDLSESWERIPQQLKSLACEFPRHMAEACQITTRPGEACDEAFAIRIRHTEEVDGHSGCSFLDGTRQLVRGNDDRIWFGCSDFICNAYCLRHVCHATHHEDTVVGFDIAKITESLPKGRKCRRRLIAPTCWRMSRDEDFYPPSLGRLLRPADER